MKDYNRLATRNDDGTYSIASNQFDEVIEEMQRAYLEWCQTDDGRQYLKGGIKYQEKWGSGMINE